MTRLVMFGYVCWSAPPGHSAEDLKKMLLNHDTLNMDIILYIYVYVYEYVHMYICIDICIHT